MAIVTKYPSINGLRAISIILVVIHHLAIQNGIFDSFEKGNFIRPFTNFLQDGHLGVNVFFVISGFLITLLMLKEEALTKQLSLKNFYIRRVLRILPAYYFLLLVYFILQLSGILYIRNLSWIAAITYMKDFYAASDWYTAHAWSVSVEEQFYLLWPFVFQAGYKTRKQASFFLILFVPIVRTYLHFYPNVWIGELNILTRIDAIAFGCLIALYKNELLMVLQNHWNKAFYFSIFILFALPYLPGFTAPLHLDFIFIPLGLTHGTIANILICVIVLYSIFGPQGFWYKMLNSKLFDYIGLLSYSIYLWQQLFIMNSTHWWQRFPYNLIFIFGAALFSYYIIEKPFLRLKSRFTKTTG
jgi:peptidoglycan/LPS O-acetylase OafA/YrhL